MYALSRDPLSQIVAFNGLANTAITAGGGGDATAANGISIDTLSIGKAEAVMAFVTSTAALGAGQKLTTAVKFQDSADNSTWADVGVPVSYSGQSSVTVVTTAAGAGNYNQVAAAQVPLEYCRRYLRVVVTPDLDRSGTDTANVAALLVFSGLGKV